MRHREDPIVKAIRDIDACAGADASEWAKSEVAAAIAERIRVEGGDHTLTPAPRPRMTSRVLIVIAVIIIAASAVAATIAVRSGSPKTTSLVGCHQELIVGGGSFLASVKPGVGPVAACREAWPDAVGAGPPNRLVACTEPQGGLVVYPLPVGVSENDACSSVGDAVYRPSDDDL